MRPTELIKVLKKRQLTPTLVIEALRHQAYVRIISSSGAQIQSRQDYDRVKEQTLRYEITRRGKELIESEDS